VKAEIEKMLLTYDSIFRRGKEMKIAISMMMTLVLAAVSGCQSSSERGGGMTQDVGFKIAVPTFSTQVKQGETKDVTVSLERGQYFKQDVKLEIKATPGITVEPTKASVKASDTPDVQLRVSAAKDAAIGGYQITVKGTPTTGEPTSTEFNVTVVAP
jgi:uncharacterized membrane protein